MEIIEWVEATIIKSNNTKINKAAYLINYLNIQYLYSRVKPNTIKWLFIK